MALSDLSTYLMFPKHLKEENAIISSAVRQCRRYYLQGGIMPNNIVLLNGMNNLLYEVQRTVVLPSVDSEDKLAKDSRLEEMTFRYVKEQLPKWVPPKSMLGISPEVRALVTGLPVMKELSRSEELAQNKLNLSSSPPLSRTFSTYGNPALNACVDYLNEGGELPRLEILQVGVNELAEQMLNGGYRADPKKHERWRKMVVASQPETVHDDFILRMKIIQ